jgi:hypothetical protein
MSKTTLLAICACLMAVTAAPAQTPAAAPGSAPSAEAAPPPPEDAGREHAVIGGKRIQPRSVPGQSGQSPEAQIRLLQKAAKDAPSNEPIVTPRDIYGNPLGGSPGADPPGLEPPPSTTPPAAPAKH